MYSLVTLISFEPKNLLPPQIASFGSDFLGENLAKTRPLYLTLMNRSTCPFAQLVGIYIYIYVYMYMYIHIYIQGLSLD